MQTKSRILHFLLVLVMGFFGIFSLVAYELFQYDAPESAVQLPEKAEWAVRVDVEQLAKNEAYTVLFKAKDEALLRTLQNMFDERMEQNKDRGPLTIDFRKDIVVFGFSSHNRVNTLRYIGIQCEVIDPDQFRSNIRHYIEKGYYSQVRGTTALVLFSPDIHTYDGGTEKDMLELAADLLKKTRVWEAPAAESPTPFLSIASDALDGPAGGTLRMDCFQEDHVLSLEGTYTSKKTPKFAHYSLKHSGLFINTSLIPAALSDTLAYLLPVKGVRLPALNALTIDYQGTVVDNSSGGMFVLPQMNMILEAETAFSADSIWKLVPPEMQGEDRTIVIGPTSYHLKQLNSTTVFIGLDPKMITERKSDTKTLCSVKGSLQSLTNIVSDSYLVAFMDMIPEVRAGKDFVAKTNSIDFSIVRENGPHYAVRGRIVFKDEAYALNETLKLVLAMNSGK